MNVYSISISDNKTVYQIGLTEFLPAKKYRFLDDKKRLIYDELTLRYALKYDMGIRGDKIEIEYNDGKPYLKEESQLFFNISHSGEYVVYAIDNHPIGVDIERIGKADIAIEKIFTFDEQKQIFAKYVINSIRLSAYSSLVNNMIFVLNR